MTKWGTGGTAAAAAERRACRGGPAGARRAAVTVALGLFAAAGTAGVAAASPAPESARAVAAQGQDGEYVVIGVGQTAYVRLRSNPSTGYHWELADYDPAVLTSNGSVFVPDPHPGAMAGVGGVTVFSFTGSAPGRTWVRLTYLPPGVTGGPATQTYVVRIRVIRTARTNTPGL